MHGLVSLLPSPYYERVETIWDRLEQRCGLTGIRVTPYPHFSWQIAEGYDFDRLEAAIQRVATRTEPFAVKTAGLGIFSGETPVVYLPVARNSRMAQLHDEIWQVANGIGTGVSEYYNDDNWAPHISLAYGDVDRQTLPEILDELAFESFGWEFEVDNISLIVEPEGQVGQLRWRIPFSG